jgi:hypothetical protein
MAVSTECAQHCSSAPSPEAWLEGAQSWQHGANKTQLGEGSCHGRRAVQLSISRLEMSHVRGI